VAKHDSITLGFVPAVSKSSLKAMRRKIREMRSRSRTSLSLDQIAAWINPMIRGWLQYYGAFYRSEMAAGSRDSFKKPQSMASSLTQTKCQMRLKPIDSSIRMPTIIR